MVFGSFWAVFVLAHVVGGLTGSGEPIELVGLLAGFMFVAPFFGLAYMAGRRPRLTGMLLLAVAAAFLLITAPHGSSLNLSSILVTDALLIVPLLATGIALLREGEDSGLTARAARAVDSEGS
jgi:hypothetical protein